MAIVAKDDKELLTNEMIYLLAKPQQIKDTDWIRPGKATWEWWHCAILEKAPFPSGHQNLSTQMYKYYIDFASENKNTLSTGRCRLEQCFLIMQI